MPSIMNKERHDRKLYTEPKPTSPAFPNWRSAITTPAAAINPTMTFRTLPHELRQEILFQTFDPTTPFPDLSGHVTRARMDEMERWAAILRSVDPCLIGDVNFVAKKWNEDSWKTWLEQRNMLLKRVRVIREKFSADDDMETGVVLNECNRELDAARRERYGDESKTYASVLKG
ncbi:hypothetical protein EG328_004180 [Venturia inaequalis]|uniref:Uncharacterized protein n=1 Tax=Venturia inaequalis TaxID=5025 RepID=A0A8H3USE1_VENIN|nr:hypothetical protein EG328_004180 [Venturia inaequalis]